MRPKPRLDGGRLSKSEEKTTKNYNNMMPDKKPNKFCGKPSFVEISDKEFAKLVKRIRKNALSKEIPMAVEGEDEGEGNT